MHKRFYLFIISAMLLSFEVEASQATQSSSHLSRAKELYRMGRWADARLELQKAKMRPLAGEYLYNQEVDFYLALCAVGLEDRLALMRLDDFQSRYPGSIYSNQVEFNKGLIMSSNEDYAAAKEALLDVDYSRLSSQERADYDVRMGYISFLEGDYDAAQNYFDRIPQNSEYQHHALYYTSYINYANGELEPAKEGFSELATSGAYGEVAPFYLLQIEFKQGNYDYVTSNGAELIESASPEQQREIARTMAEAYFRVENYEKAIESISAYVKMGGEMSREDNYILGFSLYRITHYNAAQEYLRRASGADDELTQNASYHLADCYLRANNKEGAMQAFAMASGDGYNPEIAEDALFNYGKLRYELGGGAFNEAINVLTRYIDKYPKSERVAEAKRLLAAAYYNSNSYDAAYKAIKEVRNPDADIKSALQKITYFKALEAMNASDSATAKALLKESEGVGISPKYTSLARFWQGEIDYFEGDYDSALKNFNTYLSRAPKGDPTYTMAQYSTAYALLMKSSEDSAMTYFKRFVGLNPQNRDLRADAYNRMGDILYGKRQFTEASKSYNLAAESSEEGGYYAKYQLAIIAGIRGAADEKISRLKGIITTNGGEYVDDAAYELGRTYMGRERYREAVASLEEFVANYPNSEMYAQALSDLGLSYLNLNDRSKAISYYEQAIKAAPNSAVSKDAIQGIREIYVNQGDANGYFEYAKRMGVESDLGAVAKDSLSFASAQRIYFSGGDNKRATNSLASYISDYPQGHYLTDALFLLSDCYLKGGETNKAISSLTRLSKQGANQYTQRVLERLSKLTYDAGEYSQSASAYRKLYDVVKSDAEKGAAMDGYAESVIATKDREEIAKMADDVLAQSKSGAKATVKAKHAKATILRENGEWYEAVNLYKDLSGDPHSAIGAEATYYLISNAHRNGDMDAAEGMIFNFSESQTTQAYWLAKAFITLGDIYVTRDDSFQARATYQSIVDGYGADDDGVIEEAKSKIEKLK